MPAADLHDHISLVAAAPLPETTVSHAEEKVAVRLIAQVEIDEGREAGP
jgi:hypothetical protein